MILARTVPMFQRLNTETYKNMCIYSFELHSETRLAALEG